MEGGDTKSRKRGREGGERSGGRGGQKEKRNEEGGREGRDREKILSTFRQETVALVKA